MQLDVAMGLLKNTKASLVSYCENGFVSAQASAKNMCKEMNMEAVLKKKKLGMTKIHFGYEAPDEPISDASKRLEVSFVNTVVDSAITSLNERFQSLGEVRDKFRVLFHFKELSFDSLTRQYEELSDSLSYGGELDIDGKELAFDMRNLPKLPSDSTTALELLKYIHEKEIKELYPNMWTAIRVAVTFHVTLAAAERNFSELKLIKTYLRSMIAQDRLTGLAVISINNAVGRQMSYGDIKDNFASKKTKKQKF
ncbi:putative hAT family C-terminal dimerization region-containing protein 25 [Homarus americanus]|uniref:Putative hAT family C-terminal dimerization region-containing protein 25 n=1 Tax=Homarus americanus TaxID=6706 RepID=A0A8J5MVD9_HOMAM|nr:putative hAT family C-terminal dimerization region-containing protein 25 [Homarus americanus]